MYEKHTDERLIASLSDRELSRILSGICGQIERARKIVEASPQASESMVGLLNPEFSVANQREKAANVLRLLDQSLKNYLVECVLRGFECSEQISKAYGRNSRIEVIDWESTGQSFLEDGE